MKLRITILAAFAVLLLTACNQGAAEKARVKKTTSIRGMNTEYSYNPDGTLSYTISAQGIKTTYTYSGNTVNEKMTDSLRGMSASSVVYLNSKGLADSTTEKDDRGFFAKTYNRDDQGFITSSVDYVSGSMVNTTNSVIKDGNETSTTISDSASKKLFTVYFEYYTDKQNSLTYQNFGMKFLGSDSKNPMKKFVQVLPTGDTIRTSTFNYHYDDKNRITQKVMYDSKGMMRDSTTYTY